MINRKTIKDGAGALGLFLLLAAFFVLLNHALLGWGLVTIAVTLVLYSLYTEKLPHL